MEYLINKSSEKIDNRGSASGYVHEIPAHGGLVKITDFLCFAIVFKTYSCNKKYLKREKRWFFKYLRIIMIFTIFSWLFVQDCVHRVNGPSIQCRFNSVVRIRPLNNLKMIIVVRRPKTSIWIHGFVLNLDGWTWSATGPSADGRLVRTTGFV